ncbi:hypothetical protein BJX76DRAFT_325295 [Aspergillus varians]
MMNYQKYYPVPSTYPPQTLSIPAHDPRFAGLPFSPASSAPPLVAVAIAAAPPAQPPAPPPPGPSSGPSSSSYSHRPLRPSGDHFDRPQLEMSRSAPSSAAYNYPLPDTPARTPYSTDNGYASFRRGDNVYHVSQANYGSQGSHGSRKSPPRDEGFQGASPRLEPESIHRYRGDQGHPTVFREGESILSLSLSLHCIPVVSPEALSL